MTSYHQYRSPQELHLLSILAQSASRQVSGCLRVTDGSQYWLLFLEQGKLVFASDSVAPFDRLDRLLKRLSSRVLSLVSPVRVQIRLLFEQPVEENKITCNDYEAICWLVEQQYLTEAQAGELIEGLAQEVLETLLPLSYGSYSLVEDTPLSNRPRFCQLDLRTLVEACQVRRSRRQPSSNSNGIVSRNNVSSPAATPNKPPIQTFRVQPQTPVAREEMPSPLGLKRPTIPAQQPAQRPIQQSEPSRPAGLANTRSSTVQPKATYTVACIDDSPTVLSAIEAFLDDRAFKVLRIADPVSALMQIIRNKPDLILLDVTMPNLDGYELCSLLRRHPLFKQTPIIMVTGNRGFIDRAKAKLVGASGYLTKPFTQPDLLKIVFKHLS
ncbi:response regulator [Oscillatoria sp. CS-180]|uniref:response regulator n=1 Tax=Oscillatoria sp. CS-180 TaxID=3021720 RepID=UPI00232F878E|nr:response regulator [Oscillatoria sp. CS-180]MDB9526331.1 response regulator [Oscillatoria sp. CS-180]